MTAPNWQPAVSRDVLIARAHMFAAIRRFFAERDVLEVDTPTLSASGTTDPHIPSVVVPGRGWLATSPEFFMKRLLAAGSGSIYQIAHAFRDGESGRHHNPEFLLLEWYRPGFSYQQLIDEVAELVVALAPEVGAGAAPLKISYDDAWRATTGRSHADADPLELLRGAGIDVPAHAYRLELLDLCMSSVVLPGLDRDRLIFVYDFPPNQAALARVADGVAQRFELIVNGIELANGFQELTDADEQQRRFDEERAARAAVGLPDVAADQNLITALASGLPECSGVAVGLDRLLMLALGKESLDGVMPFPVARA